MCLHPPLGNSEVKFLLVEYLERALLLKMWRSGCFISAFMVWSSFHFSLCQVFAIVVFASITAEGYVNGSVGVQVRCVFNNNEDACHYGLGIGVIAFLACFAFLLADAILPSMSNAQERKYIVMADLGFSGETFFKLFLHRWSWFISVFSELSVLFVETPVPSCEGLFFHLTCYCGIFLLKWNVLWLFTVH